MPRVKCMRCGCIVCTHCQQPKLVSCTTCHWHYGEYLETPRVLQPNPYAQECDYCGQAPVKGACHMCNRPLCDNCSMNQMPPACWVCPSKGAPQRTHLGVPEAPRHLGSSFHRLVTQDPQQVAQEADRLTHEAGRGRLTNGAWVFGQRNSVTGHVHIAGEWWQQGRSAGSSSSHQ